MAEDYADLVRRLAKMQTQKQTAIEPPAHQVASTHSEKRTPETSLILGRICAFTVFAAVAVGPFLWFHHQSEETKRVDREHEAREHQIKHNISQFAAQYGAVIDWRDNLTSKDVRHTVYSAELIPVFARQDHRPLLFIVSVKDVTLQGSQYTVHSEAWVSLGNRIVLQLRATPEQAKTVMEDSNLSVARYAVVAQIESVDASEQISQGSEERKPQFVAQGECLGILPVGQYFGDILELLPKGKAGSTR